MWCMYLMWGIYVLRLTCMCIYIYIYIYIYLYICMHFHRTNILIYMDIYGLFKKHRRYLSVCHGWVQCSLHCFIPLSIIFFWLWWWRRWCMYEPGKIRLCWQCWWSWCCNVVMAIGNGCDGENTRWTCVMMMVFCMERARFAVLFLILILLSSEQQVLPWSNYICPLALWRAGRLLYLAGEDPRYSFKTNFESRRAGSPRPKGESGWCGNHFATVMYFRSDVYDCFMSVVCLLYLFYDWLCMCSYARSPYWVNTLRCAGEPELPCPPGKRCFLQQNCTPFNLYVE